MLCTVFSENTFGFGGQHRGSCYAWTTDAVSELNVSSVLRCRQAAWKVQETQQRSCRQPRLPAAETQLITRHVLLPDFYSQPFRTTVLKVFFWRSSVEETRRSLGQTIFSSFFFSSWSHLAPPHRWSWIIWFQLCLWMSVEYSSNCGCSVQSKGLASSTPTHFWICSKWLSLQKSKSG